MTEVLTAFALAESRAFDACCLFQVQYAHFARSQRVFLPRKVPSKLRILDQIWNCTRGERTASTHRAATRAVPVRYATADLDGPWADLDAVDGK